MAPLPEELFQRPRPSIWTPTMTKCHYASLLKPRLPRLTSDDGGAWHFLSVHLRIYRIHTHTSAAHRLNLSVTACQLERAEGAPRQKKCRSICVAAVRATLPITSGSGGVPPGLGRSGLPLQSARATRRRLGRPGLIESACSVTCAVCWVCLCFPVLFCFCLV